MIVDKNVIHTPVGESTEYESCIGVKDESYSVTTLDEFLTPDDSKEWEAHWQGMPEFVQNDNPPFKKLIVNFRNQEDYDTFCSKMDQHMTIKTKTIWYPQLDRDENSLKRWFEEDTNDNQS